MDLKSKYIEVNHEYYEVDDWFVDKLKTFPRKVGLDIAKQVDQSYPLLKQKKRGHNMQEEYAPLIQSQYILK